MTQRHLKLKTSESLDLADNSNVWMLGPQTPGKRLSDVTIDWRIKLEDGTLLTDPKHVVLLRSCQQYIHAIMHDPLVGRYRMSASSTLQVWSSLRVLLRWMVCHDIAKFSELNEDAVQMFIHEAGTLPSFVTGRPVSKKAIALYARTCADLYHYRAKLADGIIENPFPVGQAHEYVNHLGVKLGKWKAVPDTLAIKYVSAALRLIGVPADDLIRINQKRSSGLARYAYYTQGCRDRHVKKLLIDETFSTIPGESEPWCKHLATDFNALTKLTRHLFDACLVTILFVAGPRISEALQLRPGCIRWKRHSDGVRYPYFTAKLGKSGGKDHCWIAEKSVLRAISVIRQLSEPLRKSSGINNYWITRRGTTVSIPSLYMVNSRLNIFAKFIRADKYKGKPWRYSTHQGRKTFAHFVTKRDKRGLGALSQHYGHLSEWITDTYYAGTDYDLNEIISEESRRDLRLSLEDILSTPRITGKGAEILRDKLRSLRFRGKAALRSEVERLIRSGVALAPCDWGYCIYRQSVSACKGDIHGPNPKLRTPALCSDCTNFVVTDTHRDWWQNRKEENVALLRHPGVHEQTRAVLTRRIGECNKILGEFVCKTDKK